MDFFAEWPGPRDPYRTDEPESRPPGFGSADADGAYDDYIRFLRAVFHPGEPGPPPQISTPEPAVTMAGDAELAVKDTWVSRGLPVLDAIVTALEDEFRVSTGKVAAAAGFPADDVVKAFYALQGTYTGQITVHMGTGPGRFYVAEVTDAARREVGQWPTGESLIEELAAGIAQAAESKTDPERKHRLLSVTRELGGVARDIFVSVASQVLGQHVPR